MRHYRLMWLLLCATSLQQPAGASEPLTTKELLGRAQVEADRKGGSDLMGRIDAGRRLPALPEAKPGPGLDGSSPPPVPQPAAPQHSPADPDAPRR